MGKLSMTTWIRLQRRRRDPVRYKPGDLAGKTVLVIGGNGGIGFEACKHFARMTPARLVIACRSKEKGEAAIEETLARLAIASETGYKADLMLVDLASFESVGAFADKYEKEVGRLDLLIENASIAPNTLSRTVDGWESSLQVNDLSTGLLAILLIPTLLKTAQEHKTTPRIVIVGSEMQYWGSFKPSLIDQFNPLRTFNESPEYCSKSAMQSRYGDTKVLSLLLVRALAQRLENTPIIVNTVTPGFCYSNLRESLSGIVYYLSLILEALFANTAEEGSRQIILGATYGSGGEEEEKLRGAYIQYDSIAEPSDWAISEEGKKAQDKLWDNLVNELALVNGKVKKIVDEHLV